MKHGQRVTIGALVVVALAVAVALIAAGGQGALAAPSIIYVDADATGGNDGSSWDNAYTDLQPALAAAASGDEIWVAAGTYKPTSGTDRYASFQMVNGVEIYGGFDPDADVTKFRDRDWVTYAAILSGDIGIEGEPSDNVYHVFYHPEGTVDGSAILDGFTITGGNADGDSTHVFGGGMYNYASSPVVTNCTFTGNSALLGGGMYNTNGSSSSLTDSTFAGNLATLFGGGMSNDYSSPTLSTVEFAGNSAGWGGGGMQNSHSSPTLSNVTFEGNSAANGGGMINSFSSPVLAGCVFFNNTATSWGGGGMSNSESSPELIDSDFLGNSAAYHGGGMYNQSSSSPLLRNTIFADNSAEIGGGMYNDSSHPTVTNCTFSQNSAETGGGMGNQTSSSPTLTNCILWADVPNEIVNCDTNSMPVVTYSDVQGGYVGTGNIDADPLFVDPGNGDFHLAPGSPCIDAGDNLAPNLPAYDFEGDDRVLDGDGDGSAIVDMGVDEYIILTISVEIDITPNTPSNMIRLGSGADVPVAILTTGEFDAYDVDPLTVRFAGAEPEDWAWVNVDGDGDDDLLLYFDPRNLDLDESDRQATLTGLTNDGVPIEGSDRVKVKE